MLLGKQKLQETDTLIFAGLVDTEENKVVAQPCRCHFSIGDHSVLGVAFHGVFSVIVVPRHAVMLKKREQLRLVLVSRS